MAHRSTSLLPTNSLLVRVVIGKIIDKSRVHDNLCAVPVKQNDPNWNCVIWVKEALEALQKDAQALGTSKLDWRTVREAAMSY